MDAMRRFLTAPRTVRVAQYGIGLIFIVSGLAKIGGLDSFAEQVHNFRLTPVALENLVAMTLPWVELVAGLALVLGIQARAGAMITAGLMVAFTLAVGVALSRGIDIECGCFGTADASRVGFTKLTENLGMTALALVASLRPR